VPDRRSLCAVPGLNRRHVLAGAAGLGFAASRPVSLRAQGRLPTVGLLGAASPETFQTALTGFLAGLAEAGLVEGRTVSVQDRWAQGRFETLPALALELVAHPVDVIATIGGNVAALAAQRATSAIPIVFLTADDPVATGLVASLSHPGGNMTGVTWLAAALTAKNLELIRDSLPEATTVGALFNPSRPTAQAQLAGAEAAAAALSLRLKAFYAASPDDIDTAFAAAAADGLRAVLVITGKGGAGVGAGGVGAGRDRLGILRSAVPRWLNEGATRARILAFTEAQPRDGGSGALYVLLRRRRDG